MNDCDVCGRPTNTVYVVMMEGARMNLCEKCAKGKTPVQIIKGDDNREKGFSPKSAKAEEPEIVADYGSRIKRAREAVGMAAKVLAEKINEKESTLVRVEKQETLPSETLRKKLEHELGIKLTEQGESGKGGARIGPNEPLSLWDAAVKKEKK